VLAEVRHILQHTADRRIMFCDKSFNVPHQHAVALCHAFAAEGAGFRWGSGDIKHIGVTDEFCHLMEDSGCF
jgi:hypothetical protein